MPPAHLHHELIARTGTAPASWLLLTHGIYGAGTNWRGIARAVNTRRPDWGIVLVDLRNHGRSESGTPPHDLAACADDLRALIDELRATHTLVTAIAGHSFGGKVVLATRALALPGLRQTWVLDASPSPLPSTDREPATTVESVLALMERLPRTFARREDFVIALVADGHAEALSRWLAMNVVADDTGRYVLRLDLVAIRAMLTDYYARDLWSAVEDPALPGDVEVVIADHSTTITAADQGRLAAAPPNVHVHHINAGHWLHIDAPAAVVELFATTLPQ